MAFRRIYKNTKSAIGFEKKADTWLSATLYNDGIFIDKAYVSSEPVLSVKQARKFADKIIGFCNKIEKKRKK